MQKSTAWEETPPPASVLLEEDLDLDTEEVEGGAEEELDLAPAELEELEAAEPEAPPQEGTNNLAQYFRDLKGLNILTPEAEREATAAIHGLETELWTRIFSFYNIVPPMLKMLGENAVANAELETLRQAVSTPGRSSRAGMALIRAAAQQAAAAVHLLDLDREHIGRALAMIKLFQERRPSGHGIDYRGQRWLDLLGDVTLMAEQVKDRKNAFIKANLRLVVSIARKYNHGKMPLADLIQEGNIGLMKAVDRFDHSRGYRFSTYASWWIRHAISRGLADKGRAVRVPVHMLDGQYKLSRRVKELSIQLGRTPTDEELSTDTGVALEKILRMRQFSDSTTSLDQEVNDHDGRRKIEFVQDEGVNPTATLEMAAMLKHMTSLMGKLRPIEADILRQRFGVGIERELTLKEIGDKYNLSRERIRQLQEQALLKLRREMAKMGLLP